MLSPIENPIAGYAMRHVDEISLRRATHLLSEIDSNPAHPANNARHPAHDKCLKAYEQLEAWCLEQQLMLGKINKVLGRAGEPDYFDMTGA